jgi:hypothetical protein
MCQIAAPNHGESACCVGHTVLERYRVITTVRKRVLCEWKMGAPNKVHGNLQRLPKNKKWVMASRYEFFDPIPHLFSTFHRGI